MTLDRIHTTHAGSLPRTPELIAANAARTFAADGFTLERTPNFEPTPVRRTKKDLSTSRWSFLAMELLE